MTGQGARRIIALAGVLFVVTSGCDKAQVGPVAATAGNPGASTPASSTPLVNSTAPPAPLVTPTLLPIVETPLPEPPAASLAVDGGDPVVGQLGTFTWGNGGSDSPWLDGAPINVGSGEQLFMSLADPIALDEWTVRRVVPGNRDGIGAVPIAEQRGGLVTFPAPPIGSWSVQVRVRFAGSLGTAIYYWLIEVS